MSKLQKIKVVFWIIFFFLFISILVTPFIIRDENKLLFSEEATETALLLVELTLLFLISRYYSREVDKKEAEAFWLNSKLKDKEKELLSALEHLGKVNVQISMIRELYEKMEVPTTKSRLRQIINETLSIIKSVTQEDQVWLRIIDIDSGRTLKEQQVGDSPIDSADLKKLSNKKLIRLFKKKEKGKVGSYHIFYSEGDNFSVKAFIMVPDKKASLNQGAERNFLKAVANECEIIFLLFTSQYYKHYPNNKK
ncbi:MAG TPA: hypothetical protein GX706_03910 [Candidatus Moranbacteria bacterium]|nr:hypothetical protein [Candidatus Moranbacteria bacterium]